MDPKAAEQKAATKLTQKQEMKMSTGLASLKAQMDARMKVFHGSNKKAKNSDDSDESDDDESDSEEESD